MLVTDAQGSFTNVVLWVPSAISTITDATVS